MVRTCGVPMCPTPKTHRSLHCLPTNEHLKNKWIDVLRLDKRKIPKHFLVCSSHFVAADFLPTNTDQVRLKKSVVPTQNIPKPSSISKAPKARKPPKERHNFSVEDKNPIFDVHSKEDDTNEKNENIEPKDSVQDAIEKMIYNLEIIEDPEEELSQEDNVHFQKIEKETLKAYADKCIQVNTLDDVKFTTPCLMDMLKTNGDIRSFTGLSGFDLLNRICICMKSVKSISVDLEKLSIPLDVAIVLVFTRIKINLNFRQCGVLFRLHPNTISKFFSNILPLLRVVLSVTVFWPSKELNSRNIPKCFKPDFVNCRGICDCTEVEIQKLKSVNSRIKSYSHYKGKHTLKFQITINPFGLITHASSSYGGKASDKYIFLNERLDDLFEEGDAVMVDKGYNIAVEVAAKGIELIRPPLLDQPQHSRNDAILNTSIARARVHVERSIERVKAFKIFQEKIPEHMLRHIDDIIVVICAVVNLSSPILSEARF